SGVAGVRPPRRPGRTWSPTDRRGLGRSACGQRLDVGLDRGFCRPDGLLTAAADLARLPVWLGNRPIDRLHLPRRGADLDKHDRHLAVRRAHHCLRASRLLGFEAGLPRGQRRCADRAEGVKNARSRSYPAVVVGTCRSPIRAPVVDRTATWWVSEWVSTPAATGEASGAKGPSAVRFVIIDSCFP